MKKLLITGSLCLMMLSGSVLAEKTMRCGNGIIRAGMSFDSVDKACGLKKAYSKKPYQKMFNVPNSGGEVKVYSYEVWEYREYGKFRMYINFYEGNVNKFWVDTSIRN